MKVTRGQIVSRGFAGRCPNCGAAALFSAGAPFSINPQCPHCGLKFDRGEGFFLGPFVINYTVTVLFFIIPVVLLSVAGIMSTKAAVITAGAGALLIPVLFYRRSWSLWLMTYFYFLPQKLPANHNRLREDEEE